MRYIAMFIAHNGFVTHHGGESSDRDGLFTTPEKALAEAQRFSEGVPGMSSPKDGRWIVVPCFGAV